MFNFLEWSGEEWLDFGIAFATVSAVLVLLFVLIKTKHTTRSLVYASISVALAFVLNLVRLWIMPYGGSVTLVRFLPLVIYAYLFGVVKGVSACAVYGVLDLLMSGWIVHPVQILLDYIIGFACIGLSGLFRKTKLHFLWGPSVAIVCRYICLVVSGVVFWGDMMGEGFDNVWIYSLAYNSVALVDMALVIAVLLILNCFSSFRRFLFNLQENNVVNEPD